eukprot:Hpha_TRINITY_DN8649_c0_g1::TRINITY_DN8649_c0_g1_i1::g.168713::m.168713
MQQLSKPFSGSQFLCNMLRSYRCSHTNAQCPRYSLQRLCPGSIGGGLSVSASGRTRCVLFRKCCCASERELFLLPYEMQLELSVRHNSHHPTARVFGVQLDLGSRMCVGAFDASTVGRQV